MSKYNWLLKLYQDIAARGKGTSVCRADNYVLTINAQELATFPTIEAACYTSAKSKQLYKNYWNHAQAIFMLNGLTHNGYAEMSLNNIPKRGKGQTTEFCMKYLTAKIVDGKLDINIYYRTTEAYRAFRADLWLFHTELSKLPWPIDKVTMYFDTIQCQCQTIYETFRLNKEFGKQVVEDAKVNPTFHKALIKQLDKIYNPDIVLKRKKDIRARALFLA